MSERELVIVQSGKILPKHNQENISVSILVREIQQEPFNLVLIYKLQGMIWEEFPTLTKKSFILAVQTVSDGN